MEVDHTWWSVTGTKACVLAVRLARITTNFHELTQLEQWEAEIKYIFGDAEKEKMGHYRGRTQAPF